MAGERVAEGILGAFFGSFVGAPLGVQAAGLVTNLLASGIYSVCGGVAQSLKTRGNHNIQKLAAASLRAAVEEGKRESGAAWGPAAVMRLDELQRDSEAVLIAMETEESRQLVEALLVGRPAGMTEVVGRLVGTYIQGQCHDWNAVQKDLAPRFFQHFREKYVHPDFAAGRRELERDVAWATLQQGETIQALVVSLGAGMAEQFEKFQAQLNRIESQADRCDTSGLRFAWIEDYFLKVLQNLHRMEEKQDQHSNQLEAIRADLAAPMRAVADAFSRQSADNEELRRALKESEARAAARAAQLPAGLGLEAEALVATANGDYREAERLYALIDEEKTREAARIKQQRGDNAFRAHHWVDAVRFYAEAYDLEPTDERNDQCGYLYALIGQSGAALPYLDRRVQRLVALRAQLEPQGQWNPEYRNDLARAYMNRGVAQRSIPDLNAAIQDYDAAIAIMDGLRLALEPQGQWNPEYRNDLASAYMNRGNAQQGVADLNAAIQDYGTAIEIMEGLRVQLQPQGQWIPEYRHILAKAFMNRGVARQGVPDLNAAIQDYDAAIAIMDGLRANLEPQGQWNPQYRNDLALARANLAEALVVTEPDRAETEANQAVSIFEDLARLHPIHTWPAFFREIYIFALDTRAAAHRALGHDDLAAEDERRAREITS
jgi:tetratricopeptide (TPR) repeat protein